MEDPERFPEFRGQFTREDGVQGDLACGKIGD
jgi:hypothetical protein